MTENDTAAVTQREGEITVPAEDTSEETEGDSRSQDENQKEDTHSSDGDNSQSDDKTPFHEHPRWKQREDEWNSRFNDQEKRHQDDLKAIREEFGDKRAENAAATKIPAWFGGTQEQWDAYRADRDAELHAAEDRAEKRAVDRLKGEQGSQEKAVQEATDYMRSEISAIEGDRTLNPTGAKIDAQKLLKTVLDNELIDTKGRWNYRAGYKLMNGTAAPKVAPKPSSEKKDVAGATVSESRGGDDKGPKVTTSADFRKDRPW